MATGQGVYHTVGRGETLWRICHTYGVDLQEVAELNNIRNPAEIESGSKVFIPGVSKVRKVVPYSAPASVEKDRDGRIVIDKERFSWPIRGEIISQYGVRSGSRHDGIDIKAEDGAPVKAADDGKAVYVNSEMRGYGNIVILHHKDDFYTVYAHNRENLIREGDNVTKGDVIAKVGNTGNASTAHLHFEVRQGKNVRNPLFFLP